MIHNTIFYLPNLLNYVRVVLVILMLKKMRTKPLTAFILCLISGMINWLDGTIARYLDQTSQFGHIMDISLDRLTNSAQMVTLALLYPRYWLFFFSILTVDTIRDFVKISNEFQHFLVNSVMQSFDMNQIKEDVYGRLGISLNKISPIVEKIVTPNFDTYQFLIQKFYKYVWFSSDLYFWLLYFNRFIKDPQDLICKPSQPNDTINSSNGSEKSKIINFIFLDSLRGILEENLLLSKTKILYYFKFVFRIFIFFLFIGVILKFYFNIRELMNLLYIMIENDDKLKFFLSVKKNISFK